MTDQARAAVRSRPEPILRAWLERQVGCGLTKQQFARLVERLAVADGDHADWRSVVRSFKDAELPQLWHAAKRCKDELPDEDGTWAEVESFVWAEILRRSKRLVVEAA